MGKPYGTEHCFDIFLKKNQTSQQCNDSHVTKLPSWFPSAVAKPPCSLSSTLSPMSFSLHLLFVVRRRQTIYSFPVWHHSIWDLFIYLFINLQKEKKAMWTIWNVFRIFVVIKITLQLGLLHLLCKSLVSLEMRRIALKCKVIPWEVRTENFQRKMLKPVQRVFFLWSDWKHLSYSTLLLFLNLPLPFPFLKLHISVNF